MLSRTATYNWVVLSALGTAKCLRISVESYSAHSTVEGMPWIFASLDSKFLSIAATPADVLVIPGAALLVVCLLAKHISSNVRRRIRPFILRLVHQQCEGVAWLQQHTRNGVLDIIVKLTALTVTVEFYLLFLPPMVWLGGTMGTAAMMTLCNCMAISTYCACVLKDLLSCPRPYQTTPHIATSHTRAKAAAAGKANSPSRTPPFPQPESPKPSSNSPIVTAVAATCGGAGVTVGVELLESAYRGEIEMGAPSMHTWCALVLPAYGASLAQQLGLLTPAAATTATAVALVWACWVALSRLYLGVHTPVDLVLGAAGGAAMWGLWRGLGLAQVVAVAPELAVAVLGRASGGGIFVELGKVASASASSAGGLVALAVVGCVYVLALATYPQPLSHTTSYEYAVIFLGAAYGGFISTNERCSLLATLLRPGSTARPQVLALTTDLPPIARHPLAVAALGFMCVALVKELSKAVLVSVLPDLLALAPTGVRRLWQPPVHPTGCWRHEGKLSLAPAAQGRKAEAERAERSRSSGGRKSDIGPFLAAEGVLMKSATLAYDVDFLRKFLNYGLTVYAVLEFRHVAGMLLAPYS